MKYAIISIDDSRKDKKAAIRESMPDWRELRVDAVNGNNPEELKRASESWSMVKTPGPFKAGEFGILYSVLNCLDNGRATDGILYFEDDAIPTYNMQQRIDIYLDELPNNWDVFALWSPHNQHYDYTNVSRYNDGGEPIYNNGPIGIFDFGHAQLSRLWQGYGNVAMAFSYQGCNKMIEYMQEKGFFSPIDCAIAIACHTGRLNGYSLKPTTDTLVKYEWGAPTTIHNTKWGMIEDLC